MEWYWWLLIAWVILSIVSVLIIVIDFKKYRAYYKKTADEANI